jgi:hypothetical protein
MNLKADTEISLIMKLDNNNGTVRVNLTIGFGNNLFQYCYSRLLALQHNLLFISPSIPELSIEKSPEQVPNLPTFYVNDKNYKQALYSENLQGKNVIVSGYFEDYKLFSSHLEQIRGWFPRVEKANTEDVVLHLRMQNRLVQESHYKNHITTLSIKKVLEKFDFNKLHIVTDLEKWETYNQEDIQKIQHEIKNGPNPNPRWVPTEKSLQYVNYLIDGLSSLEPIVHCNGAEVMKGTGGLRGNFIEDFNFLRRFEQVIIHNSTFSWWAATLSGAEKVAIYDPWKIAKPPEQRRNLGKTNYKGWFSWGGEEALYRGE